MTHESPKQIYLNARADCAEALQLFEVTFKDTDAVAIAHMQKIRNKLMSATGKLIVVIGRATGQPIAQSGEVVEQVKNGEGV